MVPALRREVALDRSRSTAGGSTAFTQSADESDDSVVNRPKHAETAPAKTIQKQ